MRKSRWIKQEIIQNYVINCQNWYFMQKQIQNWTPKSQRTVSSRKRQLRCLWPTNGPFNWLLRKITATWDMGKYYGGTDGVFALWIAINSVNTRINWHYRSDKTMWHFCWKDIMTTLYSRFHKSAGTSTLDRNNII